MITINEHITVKAFEDSFYYQNSFVTSYICNCGEELYFTTKDFYRHLNLGYTNLSGGDSYKIDRLVADCTEIDKGSHFLDFYCPTCKTPTRIYYDAEEAAGAKWEKYYYEITLIITGNQK